MTSTPSKATTGGSARVFAAITGITSLVIFLQAITAGEFVSQDHRDVWISVHDVVSDVVVVAALATAIFATVTLRAAYRAVVIFAWALFGLVVIQTVLGHLITEGKVDALIAVHVPLAFVVFGITVWLSIRSTAISRAARA